MPELLTKFESFGYFLKKFNNFFESTLGKKIKNSMYYFGEVSRFVMVDGGYRAYMLKA